jgi:MFS family permease
MVDKTADADVPVAPAGPTAPERRVQPISRGYFQYAMVILLITFVLNFIDRQIVNILAEPIKNELGLMDWQLGLMSGLAFAVFYSVLGLPIARLAERRHRPAIISVSLIAWSGFTALCGAAQNFLQLILARIGVGVGEAGCTPAAHSLIADYAPREKLASAMAFYAMGTPLGSLIGMAVGGLVADAHGWRVAFFVCGLPGVFFALIVFLTLPEPRLRGSPGTRPAAPGSSFFATLKLLARKKTFRLVVVGSSVKAFIAYGAAPFLASYFLRNHGDELGRLAASVGLQAHGFLGLTLGIANGLGGAIGAMLGGVIADHFGKKDIRAWMIVPAITVLISGPALMAVVMAPGVTVALVLVGIYGAFSSLWFGPIYATTQSIAPKHARATSTAILLLIGNLVGLGLGPLAVGALSDAFAVWGGMTPAEGVRWALVVAAMLGVVPFVLFWRARRTIGQDMENWSGN